MSHKIDETEWTGTPWHDCGALGGESLFDLLAKALAETPPLQQRVKCQNTMVFPREKERFAEILKKMVGTC